MYHAVKPTHPRLCGLLGGAGYWAYKKFFNKKEEPPSTEIPSPEIQAATSAAATQPPQKIYSGDRIVNATINIQASPAQSVEEIARIVAQTIERQEMSVDSDSYSYAP